MKNLFVLFCCSIALISCKKNNDAPVNPPTDSLKVGLIAYYPFNKNAKDESGNHYDLNAHAVLPDTDRFGNAAKAYYFDGNIGRMDFPVLAKADSLREFTISFWVKASERGGIVLSFLPLNMGPIGSNYIYVGPNNPIGDYIFQAKLLTFETTSQFIFTGSEAFFGSATDKWTHYVWVQRYNTQYLHPFYTYSHFQNNVKYDTRFEASSHQSPLPVSFSHGGTIGCEALWQPDVQIKYAGYFTGIIDDIRLYNRALSDDEVQKLYEVKE